MKTTLFDCISIGALISLLVFISWKISTFIYSLFTLKNMSIFVNNSFIILIIIFSIIYGVLSAILMRYTLFFKPFHLGEFSMQDSAFQYWKLLIMLCMFGQRSLFLISIGDNLVLSFGSLISENVVFKEKIIIGRVDIENNSTIGIYSIVMPNVRVGNNVILVTNSVLVQGSEVPDNEIWKGNPARKWQ